MGRKVKGLLYLQGSKQKEMALLPKVFKIITLAVGLFLFWEEYFTKGCEAAIQY